MMGIVSFFVQWISLSFLGTHLTQYSFPPRSHWSLLSEFHLLDDKELENFLPQLCNILVERDTSVDHDLFDYFERLVLDKCCNSVTFGMRACSILKAQARAPSENIFRNVWSSKSGSNIRDERIRMLESQFQMATSYGKDMTDQIKQLRSTYCHDMKFLTDNLARLGIELKAYPVHQRLQHLRSAIAQLNVILYNRMLTGISSSAGSTYRKDYPKGTSNPYIQEIGHATSTRAMAQQVASICPHAADRSLHLPFQHCNENCFRILQFVESETELLTSKERCPYLLVVEVLERPYRCDSEWLYSQGHTTMPSREQLSYERQRLLERSTRKKKQLLLDDDDETKVEIDADIVSETMPDNPEDTDSSNHIPHHRSNSINLGERYRQKINEINEKSSNEFVDAFSRPDIVSNHATDDAMRNAEMETSRATKDSDDRVMYNTENIGLSKPKRSALEEKLLRESKQEELDMIRDLLLGVKSGECENVDVFARQDIDLASYVRHNGNGDYVVRSEGIKEQSPVSGLDFMKLHGSKCSPLPVGTVESIVSKVTRICSHPNYGFSSKNITQIGTNAVSAENDVSSDSDSEGQSSSSKSNSIPKRDNKKNEASRSRPGFWFRGGYEDDAEPRPLQIVASASDVSDNEFIGKDSPQDNYYQAFNQQQQQQQQQQQENFYRNSPYENSGSFNQYHDPSIPSPEYHSGYDQHPSIPSHANSVTTKPRKTFVRGKTWEEKKAIIRSLSAFGHLPGWTIKSFIVKSGDDLQKEVLAMQIIEYFQKIFQLEGVDIILKPYQIICTGYNSGLVEYLEGTRSIDRLKKSCLTPPTQSAPDSICSLKDYFEFMYGPPYTFLYGQAVENFVRSLAGYSLVTYLLQVKDRHNANILMDNDGHVIHIDFGFILGESPGFNINFENAPFKLTREYIDVMGGIDSPHFELFKDLFVKGFTALQKHVDGLYSIIQLFMGSKKQNVAEATRSRLLFAQTQSDILSLIGDSIDNWRTKQYDWFQQTTNGIMS